MSAHDMSSGCNNPPQHRNNFAADRSAVRNYGQSYSLPDRAPPPKLQKFKFLKLFFQFKKKCFYNFKNSSYNVFFTFFLNVFLTFFLFFYNAVEGV